MRNIILLANILLFLSLANVAIAHKQRILHSGENVYVPLAPVDPRSLIQGDYMALNYGMTADMEKSPSSSRSKSGYVVIKTDEYQVAHFLRFYQGEKLAANEKLLKYRYSGRSFQPYTLLPNSFLFPEGQQKALEVAKYAIFHFGDQKNYLLVGLADENGNPILLR